MRNSNWYGSDLNLLKEVTLTIGYLCKRDELQSQPVLPHYITPQQRKLGSISV